jgi:predicted nucleic acid-binding protein
VPSLEVFVDTSGWASLVDKTQPQHDVAAELYRSKRQQGWGVITTNYVITELVALLYSPLRLPRTRIISIVDGIRTSPYVEVAHIDAALDENAWQLSRSRLGRAGREPALSRHPATLSGHGTGTEP